MPSERTITQYERVINTLSKRGIEDFSDTKKVLAMVETTASGEDAKDTTIRNNINALVWKVGKDSAAGQIYNKKMYEMTGKIRSEATYTTTEKSVPWNVLSEIYKKYEGQDRVMLAVYSLAPPRRLHDYASMRVVNRKPSKITGNVLVINKSSGMTFYFADYKTKATYGIQSFKVPPKLREEFIDFAVCEEPLFKLPSGKPFADTQFSTRIGDLTAPFIAGGVRATPTTYRHSYITHFLATNPTAIERMKVANMMSHAIGTQMTYDERD